ncbi:hypothetical protein BC939DRAFT_497345, partial [Gamsiella multidivaricata]|uniref:uncharacterized protein n=1 Tax=Gamsiella multidivaricata TaxID=101098 RepID=UPI00221EFD10
FISSFLHFFILALAYHTHTPALFSTHCSSLPRDTASANCNCTLPLPLLSFPFTVLFPLIPNHSRLCYLHHIPPFHFLPFFSRHQHLPPASSHTHPLQLNRTAPTA